MTNESSHVTDTAPQDKRPVMSTSRIEKAHDDWLLHGRGPNPYDVYREVPDEAIGKALRIEKTATLGGGLATHNALKADAFQEEIVASDLDGEPVAVINEDGDVAVPDRAQGLSIEDEQMGTKEYLDRTAPDNLLKAS